MTDLKGGSSRIVTDAELHAFCDGELDEAESARVAAALEADGVLRARMSNILSDAARLAEASEPERDDPATEALAAKLGAALDRKQRRQSALRFAGGGVTLAAVAAAGWFGHALLAKPLAGKLRPGDPGVVLATAQPQPIPRGQVPGFVADAAGAHAVFAPDTFHPVEFTASDEATMASWFSSHLGDSAIIPHLEELGFDLVGGRLLGGAEGPMAQVLYENDRGDRVSLVYGKQIVPGGADLRLVHVGKSYASYWQDGGFSWAVVEDSPGADVSSVATHIARITRNLGTSSGSATDFGK